MDFKTSEKPHLIITIIIILSIVISIHLSIREKMR